MMRRRLLALGAARVVGLLIVLGVQVFALGLLGELIIFTHGGGRKDYQVDRVVQYPPVKRVAPVREERSAASFK